jgi:hypothetical protein
MGIALAVGEIAPSGAKLIFKHIELDVLGGERRLSIFWHRPDLTRIRHYRHFQNERLSLSAKLYSAESAVAPIIALSEEFPGSLRQFPD